MIGNLELIEEIFIRKTHSGDEDKFTKYIEDLDINREELIVFAREYARDNTKAAEEDGIEISLAAMFCSAFTMGVAVQKRHNLQLHKET